MPDSASQRPLSPHLSIYRPQISSVLSILHRITGFALSVGSALLVAWLWAAAYSADDFAWLQWLFGTLVGQILLLGWTFALYYHLANGIRHLFWDAGLGFTLPVMTRSGVAVVVFALGMTLLTAACVYGRLAS